MLLLTMPHAEPAVGVQAMHAFRDSKATLLLSMPHAEHSSYMQAMHAFRDNKATLLLATGSASRGLDLPGVTHIVNLGVPSSAVEYLHRAGRVGRLGSLSPGEPSYAFIKLFLITLQ